jgi:hypothetical protein
VENRLDEVRAIVDGMIRKTREMVVPEEHPARFAVVA